MELRLRFDRGTLVLEGADGAPVAPPEATPWFIADPRAGGRLRAKAIDYRRALAQLIRAGHTVDDQARGYDTLAVRSRRHREAFPHQAAAMEAWTGRGRRGVVVLSTGAGKSYVAELAIAHTQRSTLVVVPTIDLMNQWMMVLKTAFGPYATRPGDDPRGPAGDGGMGGGEGGDVAAGGDDDAEAPAPAPLPLVGAVGGGLHDVCPLTVTTYDSAYIHMERLGHRFGLVIFDECHHLPGPSYSQAAESAIAPFRLGLTATPERGDGSERLLDTLIGPTVYNLDIRDLTGRYLADYEVVRLGASLSPAERDAYDRARWVYRQFLGEHRVRISSPQGWGQFIQLTSRSRRGRAAWRAWREQKRIALQCAGKLELLAELLAQHAQDQVLIFTADNDTVYELSRRHLIPAITHQTPTEERQQILEDFNAGRLRAVVTSRVLNEGVDMPAARVGVILSGSGSVREHVQRLGRILRRQPGKRAVLYELVTEGTGEEHTSERRREHRAYR